MVEIGERRNRHVPAVIPGDARLDLAAVRTLPCGTSAGFAATERAGQPTGTGTILPFTYSPELELVVDRRLLAVPEPSFNAARPDRWRGHRGLRPDRRSPGRAVTGVA